MRTSSASCFNSASFNDFISAGVLTRSSMRFLSFAATEAIGVPYIFSADFMGYRFNGYEQKVTKIFKSWLTCVVGFDILYFMSHYRIYCRSKNQMQSGHANAGVWVLEAERTSQLSPEPLMGWTQSGDTMNQIKMEFPTRKDAEIFAKAKGWRYTVTPYHPRKIKPRNYGDNFVADLEG